MAHPIAFEVELQTATGPLRGRVAIDPGPMRLAELVPTALELTDLLVSRSAAHERRQGRAVSCSRGCSTCCRQLVPLSIPEVFYLAERLSGRERARERFASAGAALERAGLRGVFLDADYDDARAWESAAAYFRLGIPCPLLDEEGACSIHPERPIACREYNVTTPAAWCSDPTRYAVRKLPLPAPLSAPLARVAAELAGEAVRLVPLTLASDWAEEHSELGRRTWPGPELFAAFLRQMSRPAQAATPPG
jgi:Fe-S-cluster containining protein